MPYKNSARNSSKKTTGAKKFDKFIMMQCGTQYLNDGSNGQTTRILFSESDDQWSWCVRDKGQVTHWFGVEKGRELLFRAIVAGHSLGTSAFFEKDDSLKGNPRINIKGVATEKELEQAKRAAANEAWLGKDESEDEDEDEDEEEQEEERPPARKSKSSSSSKTKSQPKAREYPSLEETEDDNDYDEELPY
jgi:hypothetical protein